MNDTCRYLLVGLDAKVDWEDGQIRFLPPGQDALAIFDAGTDPAYPRLVATLSLPNSIFGPPTNLAVTPDQRLALVADSMAWQADGHDWNPAPNDVLYVVALDGASPVVSQRLRVGRQPSGLAISRDGSLALVTNRASSSVTLLRIEDGHVSVVHELALKAAPIAVSFSADGRRAFLAMPDANRLAVLHVSAQGLRRDADSDVPTGPVPYNLVVSPDGQLALTVDMGSLTASDGHADSVSVIDLLHEPPRVIDRIAVGDGPEGIAISPDGRHAAVALVLGSNTPRSTWFHHARGQVQLLSIRGQRVTRGPCIDVGALPEGLAFSPDGKFLYVGNFLDADMQILAIEDGALVDTGRRIALPGRPASMRMQSY